METKTSSVNYRRDSQRELGNFSCPRCGKPMRWHYRMVICDPCKSAWNVHPNSREPT